MICVVDIVLMVGKDRKIRGACFLIKYKDSQGIIRRPINKFYKLGIQEAMLQSN